MSWWIGICFILIILLLLFSRVHIIFNYSYNQDNRRGSDLIHVNIYFYHIRIYKRDIDPVKLANYPSIRNEWKDKTLFKRIQHIPNRMMTTLNQLSRQYKVIEPILQKMKVEKFIWETECGTGSALTSGTACGALWAAKGLTVRLLSEKVGVIQGVHFHVTPHFQREILATQMHCIVSFTIVKAIPALLRSRNGKMDLEREDYDG